MKLSEYLAEHITNEDVLVDGITIESGEMELIIQQGIEAFVSTESKVVHITARAGKEGELYS